MAIPGSLRRTVLPAAAALLSLLVFALSANMLPSVVLRAAAELGVPPKTLAGFHSVQFAAFFLAAAGGGLLADRWGKRRVFTAACLCLMAGAGRWAGAQRLPHVFAATILWGLAGGIFESMSSALLCELFPKRRKLYMNLSQVLYTVGAVGGPWVAGLLLPRGFAWRLLFLGVGAWSGVLLLLFLAGSLPPPHPRDRDPTGEPLLRALRSWTFLSPCLGLFLYVLVESSIAVYANLYLRQVHNAPENWAIYSLSLFWTLMLAGRGFCALLPEHHSYERTIGLLLALSAAGMLLQGVAGSWRASLAVFALCGLLFAGTWPLLVALASVRAGPHHDSLVGLTIAAGALGCIAAPPLMNRLLGGLPPRLVFAVMALPLALAAVLVLRLPARKPAAVYPSEPMPPKGGTRGEGAAYS